MDSKKLSKAEYDAFKKAAEWFATLQEEGVSVQQKEAWEAWLVAPKNKEAWQFVCRVNDRFKYANEQAGGRRASQVVEAARQERFSRRKLLGGGLSCLVLGLSWRYTPLSVYTSDYMALMNADASSSLGEIRHLKMADGGELWLNTESAVNFQFNAKQRELVLLKGEILIETAKDTRPFLVTTSFGRLQALGTRFSIFQQGKQVLLAVQSGAVHVETTNSAQVRVNAGQQVLFNADEIQSVQPLSANRESWIHGRLSIDNLPLSKVVAELSRYHRGYLSVDPIVENIPVMGSYPINDLTKTLEMLQKTLPIKVISPVPWWVNIEAR